MARSKKTRKVGLIGVRKDPNHKRPEKDPRAKKHSGRPAGSRNNVESATKKEQTVKQSKDPRIGSKKPIALVKSPSPVVAKPMRKYATPAQELAALEADDRLATLLDKLDDGHKLSAEDQAYVDAKMARHRILCDLLSITEEDDEDDDTDDPFDKLDAYKLDDYKD